MVPVIHILSLTLLFALLLSPIPTFSAHTPESSPSPSPAFRDSPPAPPPSRIAPDSPSHAPSPDADDGDSSDQHQKSPTPAQDEPANGQSHLGDLETEDDSGGMSGGKKAGIAIGVIAAGCVVAVGALVYKRRQQNIRRAQYGYVARREFL